MIRSERTLHLPQVGDRIRLAVAHSGRWIPICWLRIGKDSSVYFGLAYDRPSSGGTVRLKNEGKSVTFKYDEVEFSEDGFKSSRVSFKADSGEIHFGKDVIMGTPIFPISKPQHLCLITFTHPHLVPLPKKKNKNDYDIGIATFELSENHPLLGALFVLPWDGKSSIRPVGPAKNMTKSCCVLVAFRQPDASRNLALQVVLGHGPEGPWPKFPGIVVFGRKDNT